MSSPYRSYVVVSREHIALNYRNVRSVVGPDVEVAGVVKADAYGHGAVEVSRVLLAEGAKWLAVSSVEEGAGLRRGGIRQARILVMGGFLPYEGEALVEHRRARPALTRRRKTIFRPTLSRLSQPGAQPSPGSRAGPSFQEPRTFLVLYSC